ncbi:carbohydrate ABC transporter permease [Salibacterium aidingense]|uniref:carbohydrate ABC transporter permease n=1 Tax=Salibacterium aidingense TaxID=384933 RepID=UPI000424CE24|nr:carbohydrate ABC transporter permease [Salibacterium aidingense]
MPLKKTNIMIKGSLYFSYTVILICFLFPLFWVVSLSLKNRQEIFAAPPRLIPKEIAFSNYAHVLQNTSVVQYLFNSGKIVIATVLLTLAIAIPAAFALSRLTFRWKREFLLIILMTQMISAVVVSVPLYRFFSQVGVLNNFYVLVIVYAAVVLPFSTWFLKGYLDTIPNDLDEAAIIDGCNRWQTLRKVIFPVSVPGVASVTILIAVQSWSQFVVPFILLDDSRLYPVSVGIVNLQSTQTSVTTHYLAAGSVLSILPVIILFVLLQRYIISALTSGAVKG